MLLSTVSCYFDQVPDIENSVRGSLKVFGLRVGVVARRGFEARVLELVADDPYLLAVTEPCCAFAKRSSKSSAGSITLPTVGAA